MPVELLVEIVKIIPALIWVIVLIFLLMIFYKPVRNELIPRLSGLKAFGVEATFIQDVKNELAKAASKEPNFTQDVLDQIARRSQRLEEIVKGAQLLLVNDVPSEMTHVRRILRSLGIFVDVARSTDEAISMLQETDYDLIISDMNRDGVADEGIRFLKKTISKNINRPTIFTVGKFEPSKGTPPFAFGITNRVDELLNLIFDVLEREKG
jgi:CheY-like chemotaxis protein